MELAAGQAESKGLGESGGSARKSKHPNSLYRKSIKPLIEKRRRARINASLEQLRKLLQQLPDQQVSGEFSLFRNNLPMWPKLNSVS
ncbi:transcription factor HES-4-like [Podarcis raffonei]|uniref:transcription factor HES-4-like n=1 Tax=Podarcis raffonei TaxID=65483 RepID=UPI0023293160|nr:transcription factor HES-4-like [Podarcis raffonei]